ncbi:MAG: cation-translocating P-type ATPase C-terminal domain-containing protein [Ilumatobacteraceae bacterium]
MVGWPVLALALGWEAAGIALVPLQLLWLNLMTDGLLGLSMGFEAAEDDVMDRPPHAPGASIWAGGLARDTAIVGTAIGLIALGLGAWYFTRDEPAWQTMMFTSIAVMQIFQTVAGRSSTRPVWAHSWRTNPALLPIVAGVAVLQLAALYTPLRRFLDVEALSLGDLALCAASGLLVLVLIETLKARRRMAD